MDMPADADAAARPGGGRPPSVAVGTGIGTDPDPATARWLHALPKVLLHEHLDGGLRPATLFELIGRQGLAAPAGDPDALARWFDDNAHAGSLERYLDGFALTVAAMASPAALARVAREAAEDAAADGVVLAEFRIAPLLFEAHGIDGDAAVDALLRGLAEGPLPLGERCGLIVCAMRHLPPGQTERAARLAARWRDRGVVGFDLAGAERGHPPTGHAGAIAVARDAGLGLTLHAGEADAAARVVEAARLGATRIGHGVRLADAIGQPAQAALVDEVRARGVHLEVCPTSNVHTGAAASLAAHPIGALWRAGVSLSVHTDNRLVSGTTPSAEWRAVLAHQRGAIGAADALAMTRQAAGASFVSAAGRAAVLRALDAFAADGLRAAGGGAGS